MRLFVLTFYLLSMVGCENGSPTAPAPVPLPTKKEIDPFPRPDVTLEEVSCDGFLAAVAKNKGKVVLVDVWGDFCIPCKQRFPHIVDMQKRYGNDGLVVVSLALDSISLEEPPDKVREPVIEFLKKNGARFPNYLLVDTEANYDKFDKAFPVNRVPMAHLFDRSGKHVKAIEADVATEDIDKMVSDLLKSK